MTPIASTPEMRDVTFTDALFTSTSAVCVTGLGVRDTGTEFTWWGQLIILVLIQAGGLGILTFSNVVFFAQTGRLGLEQRFLMEETHGLLPSVTPARLLRLLLAYTAVTEGIGAAVLTWRFSWDFPLREAAWLGVFHSVSAFCNAGFGLFADSLVRYHDDLLVNGVIMALIITGGLGFIAIADIHVWVHNRIRRRRSRMTLHSRAVLTTTAILIISGAVLIFLLELTGPAITGTWWQHGLECLFQSVTARTAGFNSVDIVALTNGTLFALVLLMFIGGSPGSTAGGIKTTTAAVLFSLLRSRMRNRPRVEMFDRSIPMEIVAKSLAVTSGFLIITVAAVMVLQVTELYGLPHNTTVRGTFLEYLFEVVSALCTVGLSAGATAKLTVAGRYVIIVCMFVGRLGPLIVASSFIGTQRRMGYAYPEERLVVG